MAMEIPPGGITHTQSERKRCGELQQWKERKKNPRKTPSGLACRKREREARRRRQLLKDPHMMRRRGTAEDWGSRKGHFGISKL